MDLQLQNIKIVFHSHFAWKWFGDSCGFKVYADVIIPFHLAI